MINKLASVALGAMLALTAGTALADPPDHAKGNKKNESARSHFSDNDHAVIRNYFEPMIREGHCPPGLAKKNNGCQPPGQAKRWEIGAPLPSTVSYYELPGDIVLHLGPVPSGYRYVRVDDDILLMEAGTGLILDAIENWGR